MQYFEIQNDSLIFRENGETVMVSPWGARQPARPLNHFRRHRRQQRSASAAGFFTGGHLCRGHESRHHQWKNPC